ncbi:lysozyme C [Labrus mixtus]|uniref:lysozyme C n=1 Tax=Labrus mixtus TaxID=508554 RepID=UPI0029C0105E|nr:lysozyme C [Labrus mixtus]
MYHVIYDFTVRARMRGLLVFLLSFSLAEGKLVSKCDLRDLLMIPIGTLMDMTGKGGPQVENKVAQIVCFVEFASGNDTTAVNRRPPPRSSTQHEEEDWTLYGLFQLSSKVVCKDDHTNSLNFCEMDCTKLLDDDISDDITCLLKILTKIREEGLSMSQDLQKMVRLIFHGECKDKKALDYFSDCL